MEKYTDDTRLDWTLTERHWAIKSLILHHSIWLIVHIMRLKVPWPLVEHEVRHIILLYVWVDGSYMIIHVRNEGYWAHFEGFILGILSNYDILIAISLRISLQDGRGVHASILLKSIKL